MMGKTTDHPGNPGRRKVILCIAGSDNTGGAGIQADILTCNHFGCHAGTVVTAVTAQNYRGLRLIEPVGADMLIAQLDTFFEAYAPDAVKIGLVPDDVSADIIADVLCRSNARNIVVDPVMGATCGGRFGDVFTADHTTGRCRLYNMASLLTPNLPEARILAGDLDTDNLHDIASAIYRNFNPGYLLIKGGHTPDGKSHGDVCTDRLFDRGNAICEINMPRIDSPHTHGTGCALSSAIACGLARGEAVDEAIYNGCLFLNEAISLGKKHPVTDCYGPLCYSSGSGAINL